jgi:hypothetical protein
MTSNNKSRPKLTEQNLSLDNLIGEYLAVSSIRSPALFRDFLPAGYQQTTLSSVPAEIRGVVVFAKVHIGMLITLYDDLADNPHYRNPRLLSELYALNVARDRVMPARFAGEERNVYELARYLFFSLARALEKFPHYDRLLIALRFDFEQFYCANRHAELISLVPEAANLEESRVLGPHNMGIVAAGTVDLMASREFEFSELGECRAIFLLGQRLGRISNLVHTLKRELAEGDLTNEICIAGREVPANIYQAKLLVEFKQKAKAIRRKKLRSFDTAGYSQGLEALHALHSALEGKI